MEEVHGYVPIDLWPNRTDHERAIYISVAEKNI